MSKVNRVAHELKSEARELINADNSPATTKPLKPIGSSADTIVGNTWSPSIPSALLGITINPFWCKA